MKRVAAVTMAVVTGILGAVGVRAAGTVSAQADDGRAPKGTHVALADLRSSAGHRAGGVMRVIAAPDRPRQLMAMVVGLAVDPGASSTDIHLVGSRASCEALLSDPADPGELRTLGPPLRFSPQGTAFLVYEFSERLGVRPLAEAESVAVAGDWDGDGTDTIGACGDLERLELIRNKHAAEGLLLGASAETGDGKLLGNLLTTSSSARGAVALDGLAPRTPYELGVSERTCAALKNTDRGHKLIRTLATFTTDAGGAAHVSLPFFAYGGFQGGVFLVSRAQDGPVAAARCSALDGAPWVQAAG